MYCPEMDFCLKEGYKGYICKKPRATPIHWRKYVDKGIEKLLREGIIERAHGRKLTFVSPAHWVPKNKDETRFRLVTDLRHLNEAVLSDTSVFPTPARVMSMVKPNSSWFIVVDLLMVITRLESKTRTNTSLRLCWMRGSRGESSCIQRPQWATLTPDMLS